MCCTPQIHHPSARTGCGAGRRLSFPSRADCFCGVSRCIHSCQKCSSVLIPGGCARVRPSRARRGRGGVRARAGRAHEVALVKWQCPLQPQSWGQGPAGTLGRGGDHPALGRKGNVGANPNEAVISPQHKGIFLLGSAGLSLEQICVTPSFPWKNPALVSFRSNWNQVFFLLSYSST